MKGAISRFALEQFFQFTVLRNPRLRYFVLSKKLASLCQKSESKPKTNHDLVARVFPRFRQFGCFYLEFSLALRDIFLSSDWTLWLLRFCFSCTRCALYLIVYLCYDRLQAGLIEMAWLQCFQVKGFPYALPKAFTKEPPDTKEQIIHPEERGLVLVLRWEQPINSNFQM